MASMRATLAAQLGLAACVALAAVFPRVASAALPESLCADGRDDDSDGLTDCSDGDCVSDVACWGQDFDLDGVANGVDCAPLDAGSIALPPEVPLLLVGHPGAVSTDALVSWDDVALQGGSATLYQLVSGGIARMWQDRGLAAATIVAEGRAPSFVDPRLTGADGDGWWYLVRTRNGCGSGDTGSGTLDDDPPFDEAPTNCDDGVDNDRNGSTDCADPACTDDPACIEICDNGVDDDADGRVDCDDPECSDDPLCPEDCANGADDDGNGLRDCADPECIGDPACPETGNCEDAIDNDGDDLTDCADADCDTDPACCPSCVNPVARLPVTTDAYQIIAGDTTGICPTDYYGIVMLAGWCYELATCPPGLASADSILTINTPLCLLVSYNDDACGASSRMLYTAVTTGLYLVGVAAVTGAPMSYALAWRFCAVEDDATECGNGIDDDFDGLTDCADAGCAGVPPC